MRGGRSIRDRTALLALALSAALLAAAPAAQAFGIAEGDNGFRGSVFSSDLEDETRAFTVDGIGIYDQAGGHPFKGITEFNLVGTTEDNVENLRVDIPPGLVPNPNAFTKCSETDLEAKTCPLDAQIGMEEITASLDGVIFDLQVPLYNVEPRPDDVARFGFNPLDALQLPGVGLLASQLDLIHPVHIVGGVRDSASIANPPGSDPFPFPADAGLFFTISDVPETLAVIRSKLTFWGAPRDSDHNEKRTQSCATADGIPLGCLPLTPTSNPSPNPEVPFLTNPTRCTGTKLTARLIVNSHAGATDNRIDQTPTLPDAEGVPRDGAQQCGSVPADGDIEIEAGTTGADSPAGPKVSIVVPQPGLLHKDELTTSHVKDVSVTLPPGMTINPSAANGLQACTDVQLAHDAGIPDGDACPPASDIGDVSVSSPLLPDELGGNAYVGQPLSGDMYRLFVTVEGRGVSIRLKGSVRPNPMTGQLTAIFENNPELPFDDLSVDFRDGALAPLATPLDCGPKQAAATLTPWSGTPPVDVSSDPFAIGGAGCPAGFAPGFGVALASSAAGAFSPITASISRPDRNQFLDGVRVDTPPGLAAMISRVDQCPEAQAATGACPAGSRIGTVRTAAGAGPQPFQLSGPVYFTGPYKGAPFGAVAVIRAIAGPYDLGTVVVRQQIRVDPEDASVTVISDPLPRILEGVPIRLRTADVSLDKPGFVYNPTSCGPKQVGATLSSTAGATAGRSAALAIDRCDRLAFKPKMGMRLIGARQMRFRGHPRLRAIVRQPGRQANIGRARVALPASLALDPRNAQNVCEVEAAQRADCPKSTRIGFARAISPALNEPLKGPVYFVQGIRVDPETGNEIRTLPSLLAKLRGEIAINLRGITDVRGRRSKLVSVFQSVPDAPVSRFAMNVRGGRKGPLVVTARRGVCRRRQVARVRLFGHNGKNAGMRVKMRKGKPCHKLRRAQRKRRLRAKRRAAARRSTIAGVPTALAGS